MCVHDTIPPFSVCALCSSLRRSSGLGGVFRACALRDGEGGSLCARRVLPARCSQKTYGEHSQETAALTNTESICRYTLGRWRRCHAKQSRSEWAMRCNHI